MRKNAMTFLRTITLSGAVLFALASCEKKTENVDVDVLPVDSTEQVATDAPMNSELTDAQIASIAVTANQADINYAKIAEQKATDPEVKKFAKMMAMDHQSVIDQAVALVTKLNVTSDDNNDTTKSLMDGETTAKAKLEAAAKGPEFDKAYVDNEVTYHTAVIDVVDNTLIPNAQNPELKKLLETASPVFKQHLEHAKKVQAGLNK